MEKAVCTLQHSSMAAGSSERPPRQTRQTGSFAAPLAFTPTGNFCFLQAKQTLWLSRAARSLKPVTSGVEGYCSHQPRCEPDGPGQRRQPGGIGASLAPTH